MLSTALFLLPLLSTAHPAPAAAADDSSARPLPASERISANPNQSAAGQLRNGVLTVHLEVRAGEFFPEDDRGASLPALAFAEVGRPLQIPGPLIRVPQGTQIRVLLRNPFTDSTLTVHGLESRTNATGAGLRIPGGETREVRFRADRPGTFYYWGSTTGADIGDREWFESQLSGALIVDPPASTADDRVFVMGIWARPADSTLAAPRPAQEVMIINGKSWPHTERFTYTEGDSVRWRWINATRSSHPMHLHGFYFNLDSRGDANAERTFAGEERPLVVTHLMLPAETMRISWMPEREGNWVFHCHFAFHVSHHLALKTDHTLARAGALDPESAAASSHAHHAQAGTAVPHVMAGLVLGISVQKAPSAPSTARAAIPARDLRLLVQTAPQRFGPLAGMGYVLQEGNELPARDSILIPGPMLVLKRDEPVRISIVNHLAEPTAVHWHGIELESFPDGVPGWSGTPGRLMPPIAPADSFVAEFVPPRSGTFIYHTHFNEQLQMGAGLYGALLVVDPDQPYDATTDKVILVGGAGPADSLPQFGFESPGLVNGSTSPQPIHLKAGTAYRLRFININPDWRVIFSLMSESALATWRPLAKDGADLPHSQRRPRSAYLLTGPGETADFEFTPLEAGELRLEIKTQLPGWIIPIRVIVE